MRLVLHPKVYSDVAAIMEYYEQVATPELADAFYKERSSGKHWKDRTRSPFANEIFAEQI